MEPMMQAVVKQNQLDTIDFMLKYLEETFDERATNGDYNLQGNLQKEIHALEAKVAQ